MIKPGFFPFIEVDLYGSQSDLVLIETFLDNDVNQFLVRSQNLSLAAYQAKIAEIESLKSHLEFDFYIHHYEACFESSQSSGLHLTQKSTPLQNLRQKYKDATLGYSVHCLDEALWAEENGADYLILGAIFDTPKAHPNHPTLGLKGLKAVCANVGLPVFAIGGVCFDNLQEIKKAGAYGFCLRRPLQNSPDFNHEIARLVWQWNV